MACMLAFVLALECSSALSNLVQAMQMCELWDLYPDLRLPFKSA